MKKGGATRGTALIFESGEKVKKGGYGEEYPSIYQIGKREQEMEGKSGKRHITSGLMILRLKKKMKRQGKKLTRAKRSARKSSATEGERGTGGFAGRQ